ncbi:MAG TPA: hypothetical protein DEP35_20430 [Deltaproteobacteria bacterium]|nr:hypothetical protein [Deltaproteobacteria bacterium]
MRGVRAVSEPSLEWIVVRPQENAAELIVRVEQGDGNAQDAARACSSALMEKLGVTAKVEILPRGALGRSGYKINRVVEA